MSRARNLASLLRWLGPWTKETESPPDVARTAWTIREGELRGHRGHVAGVVPDESQVTRLEAYVYTPKRPVAVYVLVPGLHFAGPDDVRLDRFCRVVAHAGFVVVAPFLPGFVDMKISASVIADLEAVVIAVRDRFHALGRPTLFSISFGSWPALEVAARRDDLVDGVITFGGYAEFDAVARFCTDGIARLDGETITMRADPLNLPALFVNVLPFMQVEGDTRAIELAFREMCYRTWGRMELKEAGRLIPFVEALVHDVPPEQQALFRACAGGGAEAHERLERALAAGRDVLAVLDPSSAIARLTCPVVVCHGSDDDVIPWVEGTKLHRALVGRVPTRLHLTGLYAHTGHGRPKLRDIVRETKTMLALAWVIAQGGRLREAVR
jgi:pimeloyl-ACP methyl ester carboxylesterase